MKSKMVPAQKEIKTEDALWVRTSRAAREIGLSQVTIWRWAVDRKIPSCRPGGPGTWLLVDLRYLREHVKPRQTLATVRRVFFR